MTPARPDFPSGEEIPISGETSDRLQSPPSSIEGSLPASGSDGAKPASPLRAPLTRHRSALSALTGVRFFAALYVIALHTRLWQVALGHGFRHLSIFVFNGYLAVTLFFMLSGFILSYNYRGQIETRNNVFRFWEARFARIWPAYAFSLLCSSFPLSRIPPPPLAAATLLMVQAWDPFHPDFAEAWNFVCWSLSVEAFFYLTFPFLQKLIEKLRLAHLLLFGLSIMLLCVVCDTPFHSLTSRFSGPFFYIPAPLIHLPTFLAGVVLGNLYLQNKRVSAWFEAQKLRWNAKKPIAASPSGGSSFAIFTWAGLVSSIAILVTVQGRWEGLTVPAFFCLLYGLASERTCLSRFLSLPLLILGGEISYSMYLLRTPVQVWIIANPMLHNNRAIDYLYVPLVVIPFALFSFYVIEGPSRRALRRMFASLQGRNT